MEKIYDYIIVGQGLAGTLMAWFLELAGKTVFVIDRYDVSSSSNIAAGIIHPVTGRRLVKSWKADDLIPFAEYTYTEIGRKFNTQFYHQKPILEIYSSVKHKNDWQARSTETEMIRYCGEEIASESLEGIKLPLGGISINQSGYLMTRDFLSSYRNHLIKKDACLDEKFSFYEMQTTGDEITWKTYTARDIIFCEGHCAQSNPFFSWLPFVPAKGEILSIESPELSEQHILNRAIYVLPFGNQRFVAGATHEWSDLSPVPTADGRNKIKRLLDEMISVPYTITGHFAAIRPTVKDRRPFLGSHPQKKTYSYF